MITFQKLRVASYQQEKEGNDYCGDSYFFSESDHGFICVIADGLGSGKVASESSQTVIDVIKSDLNISDVTLVRKCVQRLAGKRGAVLGILRLNYMNKKYTYSSIGNISLITAMDQKQRIRTIPRPGFLGNYERPLKVVEGNLEENMRFLMFSDGVTDQELAKLCLFDENVDKIIETYTYISDEIRKDDTTLIAMRYMKNT